MIKHLTGKIDIDMSSLALIIAKNYDANYSSETIKPLLNKQTTGYCLDVKLSKWIVSLLIKRNALIKS